MKLIEIFLEVLGWLFITFGTTLGTGLIALVIYSQTQTAKLISIALVIIGFIGGAVWATRIWIKYGTMNWLSRIRRIS